MRIRVGIAIGDRLALVTAVSGTILNSTSSWGFAARVSSSLFLIYRICWNSFENQGIVASWQRLRIPIDSWRSVGSASSKRELPGTNGNSHCTANFQLRLIIPMGSWIDARISPEIFEANLAAKEGYLWLQAANPDALVEKFSSRSSCVFFHGAPPQFYMRIPLDSLKYCPASKGGRFRKNRKTRLSKSAQLLQIYPVQER